MNNESLTLTEYDIKGLLGRGTFSKVKLGVNKITKEKVAIKIIDKKYISNENNYERIKREIYILKKAHHPNIIKVNDIREDSKNYYIIMEYCRYGELFKQIINKKHLDSNLSSFYFFQLINGLSYLHSNQIIHRDLKPENLLIGDYKLLKIIDFGLSNFSSNNEYLSTPCGSPSYAPPEMIVGNKYNGMLGDIWSCGIILFVMLCGYLPFDGKNNSDLFNKIVKCKVNYPKNMDKNAVDLLRHILISNPSKRINMDKIKNHQFYLKGRKIFEEKYPDLLGKIENENKNSIMINKEIKNLFDENKNESEIRNKLNYDNINEINKSEEFRYKSFENQKENNNNNVDQNDNKNVKDEKKENNLFKSNLLLKTKNINYYKRILSDRLNIQKIKQTKNGNTDKIKLNNIEINTLKNFPSKNKTNNKFISNTNLDNKSNTISKNESTKDTKTININESWKERSAKKKDIISKSLNNNYLKNSKFICKIPNHLRIKHSAKNAKIFGEEEKNVSNDIYGIQKDTKTFNVNSNNKNKKLSKKIYKNEIKNFSGDNLNNKLEKDNKNDKNNINDTLPKNKSIYVNKINDSKTQIKKKVSSYKTNIKLKRLEERIKNELDNSDSKDTYNNKGNILRIKESVILKKNKNLKIQSTQELYQKNNELFPVEKSIITNVNLTNFSVNKLCNSLKKENLNLIKVLKPDT